MNNSSFLDREITSEFMLTIQAIDEASPGLTKSAIVLVDKFSIKLFKNHYEITFELIQAILNNRHNFR